MLRPELLQTSLQFCFNLFFSFFTFLAVTRVSDDRNTLRLWKMKGGFGLRAADLVTTAAHAVFHPAGPAGPNVTASGATAPGGEGAETG